MFKFILPSFNLNVERWKWNDEYRVYVSNLGHFKDEHKKSLPIKINTNGYCLVKTDRGLKLAHRIVMLTWCPIPDAENLTVDHLDHNKRDNSVKNLEWVTKEENWRRSLEDRVKDTQGEVKPQPVITTVTVKKVTNGTDVFDNLTDAAIFALRRQNPKNTCPSKADKKKTARRITAAIEFKKQYYGFHWDYVEVTNERRTDNN